MATSVKVLLWISLAIVLLSLVSLIILERALNLSLAGTEKPSLSDIPVKVVVLNGCGREGLAAMFTEKLRNMGFDVVNGLGGNAESFDFDTSVVVDRKGTRQKAEVVGQALGINTILDQRSGDKYLIEDVRVILGRDWNTLLTMGEDSAD